MGMAHGGKGIKQIYSKGSQDSVESGEDWQFIFECGDPSGGYASNASELVNAGSRCEKRFLF